jgi:stage III sporulation protein AG
MDIAVIRNKLAAWIRKYRYIAIVLAVGVVLMLWPTGTNRSEDVISTEPTQERAKLEVTEEQLESVLSQMKGVGKVEVLLTCAAGERSVFHADERSSLSENNQSEEYETVLITDKDRTEEALVSQVIAPEYLGAVIVCQGASDPAVRLAVSDAVSKATGLGMDRISVLMMK